MEDLHSCFMKLKTVSGNLETDFVVQEFVIKGYSSSKMVWIDCTGPEIRDFIVEVCKRQEDGVSHRNNFEFDLITELYILKECRLTFDFDYDITKGVFVKYLERESKL
jgi:hypothetical protein